MLYLGIDKQEQTFEIVDNTDLLSPNCSGAVLEGMPSDSDIRKVEKTGWRVIVSTTGKQYDTGDRPVVMRGKRLPF